MCATQMATIFRSPKSVAGSSPRGTSATSPFATRNTKKHENMKWENINQLCDVVRETSFAIHKSLLKNKLSVLCCEMRDARCEMRDAGCEIQCDVGPSTRKRDVYLVSRISQPASGTSQRNGQLIFLRLLSIIEMGISKRSCFSWPLNSWWPLNHGEEKGNTEDRQEEKSTRSREPKVESADGVRTGRRAGARG